MKVHVQTLKCESNLCSVCFNFDAVIPISPFCFNLFQLLISTLGKTDVYHNLENQHCYTRIVTIVSNVL